jgi:hypothetical protein
MRRTLRSIALVSCFICGAALTARADQPTYQTANIFQFMNPANQLGGAATLFRYKQGVEMRIATSGLNPNAAYTVWWVVFNNPAACVGGCGLDDLSNPAARAAVFYAAGFVTGADGTGNVAAYLGTGALPEGIDVVMGSGLEPGNGYTAEIHVVVRTHGAINPGHVAEQIGSFNGACNPSCGNQQAAMFLPVQ